MPSVILSSPFPLATAHTSWNPVVQQSFQIWGQFRRHFGLQNVSILSPLVKNPLFPPSLMDDVFNLYIDSVFRKEWCLWSIYFLDLYTVIPPQLRGTLAFLTLLVRHLILQDWKQQKPSTFIQWMKDLMSYLHLEKIRYTRRNDIFKKKFAKIWEPFWSHLISLRPGEFSSLTKDWRLLLRK